MAPTVQLHNRGTALRPGKANVGDRLRGDDDPWTHGDPVKVLIVDAHRLSGELLATILADREMDVVGVSTSAADALLRAQSEGPDIAVIDLEHPEDAVALGSKLLEIQPNLTLLALSTGDDRHLAGQAMRAGFHGCVTRDISLPRFFGAMRSALNGDVVISHRLTGTRSPDGRRAQTLGESLTRREREVLELLVGGSTSEDIARKLSISANTVRTHVSSILTKLQVHSRLEAVTFATRHQLVHPSVIEL